MKRRFLSIILALTLFVPYVFAAEEEKNTTIYSMNLEQGLPESISVDAGLEIKVAETDGKTALEITAAETGKYLYITVPFKKDVSYCISYNIKTKEGAGTVRPYITRQESFPNMELLSYTRTLSEEWQHIEHSYKCFMDYDFGTDDVTGEVSIPFNTANTYYITDFTVYEREYDKIAYEFPYKPFSDMDEHWSKAMVTKMAFEEVVNGFSDGTFRPDNTVTRAEFITMVMNYTKDEIKPYNNTLSDVSEKDWFAGNVMTAVQNGYIPESMTQNGKFFPNTPITREEMAAITACIYKNKAENIYKADLSGYTDIDEVSSGAYDDLSIAVRLGILKGTDATHISPKLSATRAQAAVMLARLSQAIDNIDLKNTFVNFCEELIDACENDGQNEFARDLEKDLEYFKENTLVEHSGFREGLVSEVDSFYENPYVRMMFNSDESFGHLYNWENAYPLHVNNKTIKNWITRYIMPASHANTASTMMFLLGTPESPYSGSTAVLDNLLTMIESLSHAADDNGDVAGFYGSTDANYNMFFYDPYCVMYYTFINTFPCFNLPSLSERYSEFITTGIEFIQNTYGKGGYYEHYQNVDLLYLNSLMAAGMVLDREDWIAEAENLIEIGYNQMFEDGGTPYIYNETEIPSYHFSVLRDFMRIYSVCHNETIEKIMKKTEGYYKTAIEPSGVSTLGSSILIWKRSNATMTTTNLAPIITYKFTNDEYNKKMAQLQLLRIPSLDYGDGAIWAMAMCWSPELNNLNSVEDLEFEDNFIIPNSNVNGFTGRFGNFSFVGDCMSRIVTEAPSNVPGPFKVGKSPGRPSSVGATISNAQSISSKTSVDSQLHMAYSAVKIGTGTTPKNYANTAGKTWDSYIITDDFATLSTAYKLGWFAGNGGWEYFDQEGWLGKQTWYTAKDRMIGYIALEAQDTNNMSDMMTKLMFAEGGHNIEKIDETHYKYGKFRIHVIKTNYNTVKIDDNAWRITAESHKGTAKAHELIFGTNSTEKIYKGESKYCVFDIYPEWAEDAQSVVFSRLPEGVIKLDIKENSNSEKISLLYNETDREVSLLLDKAKQVYEVSEQEQQKSELKELTGKLRISPYEHAVVK